MSEKKSNPSEDKQNSVAGQEQQSEAKTATAVLDKPKPEFEDDDKVTVLHGWGRVHPGEKHFVDKFLFKDGIARNVPYAVAKHWQKNTRPDGKHDQVYGKVHVHILSNDADEPDFCKATGVTPMPVEKFAAQLAGVDLEALVTQMGIEKVKGLIAGLEKHLPTEARR